MLYVTDDIKIEHKTTGFIYTINADDLDIKLTPSKENSGEEDGEYYSANYNHNALGKLQFNWYVYPVGICSEQEHQLNGHILISDFTTMTVADSERLYEEYEEHIHSFTSTLVQWFEANYESSKNRTSIMPNVNQSQPQNHETISVRDVLDPYAANIINDPVFHEMPYSLQKTIISDAIEEIEKDENYEWISQSIEDDPTQSLKGEIKDLWEDKLPKCFGVQDGILISNERNRMHLIDMLKIAKEHQIGKDVFQEKLENYLQEKYNASADHIKDQIYTFNEMWVMVNEKDYHDNPLVKKLITWFKDNCKNDLDLPFKRPFEEDENGHLYEPDPIPTGSAKDILLDNAKRIIGDAFDRESSEEQQKIVEVASGIICFEAEGFDEWAIIEPENMNESYDNQYLSQAMQFVEWLEDNYTHSLDDKQNAERARDVFINNADEITDDLFRKQHFTDRQGIIDKAVSVIHERYEGIDNWIKINKYHYIWIDQIPACFGKADGIFAMHPSDERRARKAITVAIEVGATKDEFKNEMAFFLNEMHNASEQHIAKQKIRLDELWDEIEETEYNSDDDISLFDELEKNDDLSSIKNELEAILNSAEHSVDVTPCEIGEDGVMHLAVDENQLADDLLIEIRDEIEHSYTDLSGLSNACPNLWQKIEKYYDAIKGDKVSIYKFYRVGIALINEVDSIEKNHSDNESCFETYLEKESTIKTIIHLHQSYIMANDVGRKLAEGAAEYRQSPEKQESLKTAGQSISDNLNKNENIGDDVKIAVKEALNEVGIGKQPERSNQVLVNVITGVATTLLTDAVTGSMLGEILTSSFTSGINWVWNTLFAVQKPLMEIASMFPDKMSWLNNAFELLDRVKKNRLG